MLIGDGGWVFFERGLLVLVLGRRCAGKKRFSRPHSCALAMRSYTFCLFFLRCKVAKCGSRRESLGAGCRDDSSESMMKY